MEIGCPFKVKCEQSNNESLDDLDCCDHEYRDCKIYQLYLKEEKEWSERKLWNWWQLK